MSVCVCVCVCTCLCVNVCAFVWAMQVATGVETSHEVVSAGKGKGSVEPTTEITQVSQAEIIPPRHRSLQRVRERDFVMGL